MNVELEKILNKNPIQKQMLKTLKVDLSTIFKRLHPLG